MSRGIILACGSPLPVRQPSAVSRLETRDSDLCAEAENVLPDPRVKTVVAPDFVVCERQRGPRPRGEFRDRGYSRTLQPADNRMVKRLDFETRQLGLGGSWLGYRGRGQARRACIAADRSRAAGSI